jgi:PTS system mannose-specific IID component
MAMAVHGIPHMRADTRTMAFLRSFMRCYLTGAAFNTRGMQNIGLMYAMLPGLTAIHEDPKALKAALKRYARHYQSHPFWTPCMVGILLNVETTISAGHFPPRMLGKVKDTTSYTLSAIGDSVFAGSALIFWALLTICLLLTGYPALAFAIGLAFACGVKQGFRFLEKLRRWDLINWGTKVKYANAALLLWLWTLIWPRPYDWWEFAVGLSALMLFGRYVRTGLLSRVLAVAVFVGLIEFFPWMETTARTAFGL